jgi:hypothetical protein
MTSSSCSKASLKNSPTSSTLLRIFEYEWREVSEACHSGYELNNASHITPERNKLYWLTHDDFNMCHNISMS